MNLWVRPFNADDAPTFFKWYHDPRLAAFYRGFVGGLSAVQAAQAPQILKGHILVGIDTETGQPVGAVTLADQDNIIRIYKFGLLVDPECQHKGYGRELVEKGLAWAFDTMNAHKVICEFIVQDVRIFRGFILAGFKQEGHLKKSVFLSGEFKDEILLGLLQSDYREKQKEKYEQHNE